MKGRESLPFLKFHVFLCLFILRALRVSVVEILNSPAEHPPQPALFRGRLRRGRFDFRLGLHHDRPTRRRRERIDRDALGRHRQVGVRLQRRESTSSRTPTTSASSLPPSPWPAGRPPSSRPASTRPWPSGGGSSGASGSTAVAQPWDDDGGLSTAVRLHLGGRSCRTPPPAQPRVAGPALDLRDHGRRRPRPSWPAPAGPAPTRWPGSTSSRSAPTPRPTPRSMHAVYGDGQHRQRPAAARPPERDPGRRPLGRPIAGVAPRRRGAVGDVAVRATPSTP